MFKIALDFDGTLVTGKPLKWRPGAREAVLGLLAQGHALILHSCRNNPMDPTPLEALGSYYRTGLVPDVIREQWERFGEMRRFLQAENLWAFVQVWQSPGKPLAEVYIDDRAQPADWASIASDFGLRLSNGQQGSRKVGQSAADAARSRR